MPCLRLFRLNSLFHSAAHRPDSADACGTLRPVPFGHYAIPADQPHFFGKAVCLDFGRGYRAKERAAPGFTGTFTTRLGAARFPKGILIFDDGSSEEICSVEA
jgi:hypothetical protein